MDVCDLPVVFERRRSQLRGTPTGVELIDLFFSLAREPIGEVETLRFYVDLSFERLPDDPEIARFDINYDIEPAMQGRDLNVDDVAAALHANKQLMRIIARHRQTARSFLDDLPGDADCASHIGRPE